MQDSNQSDPPPDEPLCVCGYPRLGYQPSNHLARSVVPQCWRRTSHIRTPVGVWGQRGLTLLSFTFPLVVLWSRCWMLKTSLSRSWLFMTMPLGVLSLLFVLSIRSVSQASILGNVSLALFAILFTQFIGLRLCRHGGIVVYSGHPGQTVRRISCCFFKPSYGACKELVRKRIKFAMESVIHHHRMTSRFVSAAVPRLDCLKPTLPGVWFHQVGGVQAFIFTRVGDWPRWGPLALLQLFLMCFESHVRGCLCHARCAVFVVHRDRIRK